MNKKVLIAEDEAHVARVLKMILEKNEYQVHTVANGELAKQQLEQEQPDVLITDIQMPKMDGRALCEWIETELPDRQFLIFVLTSRTEVEHREWTAGIKRLMFLEKPVSGRQLIAQLDSYFQQQ